MKNSLGIVIICLMLVQLTFLNITIAQDDEWASDIYKIGTLYPGHIIKKDGSKVEGFIEALPRASKTGLSKSNQNQVLFYTDRNSKKTKVKYKPEELKGYKMADKVYKTMHYSGGLIKKPQRCLLVVTSGKINICEWWNYDEMKPEDTGYSPGKKHYEKEDIFQKGDEMPVRMTKFAFGFSKKFAEYISDNPVLSKKVKNKEKGYRLLGVYGIIAEYNKGK